MYSERVEIAEELRGRFVRSRLDEGTQKKFVGTLVEFGDRLDRFERALVLALQRFSFAIRSSSRYSRKRTSVPRLARRVRLLGDFHAVDARLQELDRVHHFDELACFFLVDLPGHEDAEVPCVFMHEADDDVAAGLDFLPFVR